ncbi:PepSY domain-containing protein [Roseinatronobacter alkalisoli]|uniref:PepSY domain-containing protein n=1 Tax=Roseinatronobacter alkalisoli TaxID=3028235 RepID=A0ABT5T480_9RHOB|nr:PepSY domain-containing protein [Roseinatronobacter sp. HJB301]MDD7969925.1 PepSY domain-containing protein [Roseinatronobacter sp. HJB301]
MKLRYIFPVALAISAGPALADRQPPQQALPLSEIVTALESRFDIAWIDEIEWDDEGYWDVELYARDGSKIELKVDPVTGQPLR